VHPHEEAILEPVTELLTVHDVAATLEQEGRDGVHDPGTVGASDD